MVYYYATIFLFCLSETKKIFLRLYIYELLIINCLLMHYDSI